MSGLNHSQWPGKSLQDILSNPKWEKKDNRMISCNK